jgi:hypothetical protein
MFIPNDEGSGTMVEGFTYTNPGEKINGSSLGDTYEILTFDEGEEGYINEDLFEGILVDPVEYVARMVVDGFYGVIGKKTTTSGDFFQDILQRLVDTREKEV